VAAAIVVAVLLQVALPDRLTLASRWLLPGLELALLIALVVANPRRFNRESPALRAGSLALTGLLSLANAWSASLLILGLVRGQEGQDAGPLLSTGAAIWLTNIIAFGLWYWQPTGVDPPPEPTPDAPAQTFSSCRCKAPSWPTRSGNRTSWTTCTCRSPTPPRSAPPM